MATKKPGDETIRGSPGFPVDKEDSFIGKVKIPTGEQKSIPRSTEAAPEVSQGIWRERPYVARAVMSREEIKSTLQSSLRVVMGTANHPRVAFDALKGAWMPVLRQALEQAGGDGLDSWLSRRLANGGMAAKQGLFEGLGDALLRLRSARDLAHLEEEALKTVAFVDASFGNAAKLSFKQMEKELEGKLEVDELLGVRAATTDELQARMTDIGGSMALLRDQLKKMPGRQPGGIFGNFVRLKAELRVIDAELKARSSGSTTNPGL